MSTDPTKREVFEAFIGLTEEDRQGDVYNNVSDSAVWYGWKAAMRYGPGECHWTEDPDDTSWNTDCGRCWSFVDGGIEDNGVKHCHGCGAIVVPHPFSEEAEDASPS